MVQRKINTLVIKQSICPPKSKENVEEMQLVHDSKTHNNYKTKIKLNVIEFECPFHFCVSLLNHKMVSAVITQMCFSMPGSLQLRE